MNKQIEIHPISSGFVQSNTEVLIIGTFPPKKEYVSKGENFFFYSSEKNQFWNRVDNIFPNEQGLKKTKSKNNKETLVSNKKRKEEFSKKYKIGFLDIFTKVSRKNDTANDIDLISIENIIENKKLLKLINSKSKIKRVCCTYKLAFEVLKISMNTISKNYKIINDESTANNEKIEAIINGKKIDIILLYPATRSSHKGELKDQQYKKFLFNK